MCHVINCISHSHITYNPGFEGRLQLSTVQLLPVNASKEGMALHSDVTALRSNAAQTLRWILGQELSKQTGCMKLDKYH